MPTVFLTGFPGFLGSALVERLLDRHDDETTVTCLIQSKYRAKAEASADEIEAEQDADGRIELVEGDITDAELGLGDDYDDLQDESVEVYHLAAIYDLTMDREPGKHVNIEGTRHVLDFAEGADVDRLHYVSTVVVSGLYEGTFTEDMLQEGQLFGNYYETTKHMAEVLVQQRMDEIPTTIYRPAVAVGDSETGETQKYDGPYAFVEMLLDQGDNAVIPAPRGASNSEFNLVPRDYVVDAIGYLSGIDESEGTVYHLADPNPPTTTELIKTFGEALGKKRTLVVPYPKGIVGGLLESLSPENDLIKGGALEYQTWSASFDCSNTLEDLEGSGVECPDFEDYAGNLVEFVRENPDIDEGAMN
ncbi:SDR family oxidoreductase [Natronomonas salina]|uniref:SDR family oxidoreductase n=1 Tax=Natronomonas salina TaxID=1710540 RepID=UPI0015B5922D|nr:SDR family oxidoreductase [Natronomonas salina]QLD90758.1 SDR family oxidoreductase [Natronomonas salina]